MNINRTCTIELSRDEVAEALTDFVQKHKGYSSKLNSWEEVLGWSADRSDNLIRLTWGEKPEPVLTEPPPVDTSKDDVPF